MNGGGMALQRWCCTPPGRGAAVFSGYGRDWGKNMRWSGHWVDGGQRLTVAVGPDERNTDGVSRKGGNVQLAGGFQCRALQLDKAIGVVDPEEIYGSELQGFVQRVAACNQGRDRKVEFLPFMVEKDTVGFIHYRFAEHLRRFPDVFSFEGVEVNSKRPHVSFAAGSVTLTRGLSSPQQRTVAIQGVLEVLKREGLIPGWRDELLPVTLSYGASSLLLMERAAFPFFGAKQYGVHMNGYVNVDGEKHLWVARRSDSKQTFPGLLDHIVAGGQPEGLSAKDNLIKECDEEAAIPAQTAEKAVPVGAVSYEVIKGETLKRDVLFCYDLELPLDFQPYNKDGEVQRFYRLPISEVLDIISKTDRYKPNCALVIIDFFIRHGYIIPDQKGYLSLLQSLRTGEL